jgi:NitT/TauT family transport system permease protein
MSGLRRVASNAGPPLIAFGIFLALWEAVVKVFDLKPYFLTAPTKILGEFGRNFGRIWESMKLSGTNALVGLVCGVVLGVAVAFLVRRFRFVEQLVTPLSTALNAIPIVVLVSVFSLMFALTSSVPRRLTVTLGVFFVVLVNVAKGLTQVNPTHVELMRSYAATETAIMRKVRIPNAVPYLFTALKIAAPLSVITAFVSEYFGGSQNGLGNRIASNMANSKNATAWAYVLGACLLGLAFYAISIIVENVATPGGVKRDLRE